MRQLRDTRFRFGAGFTPAYLSQDPSSVLKLHPSVTHLELGLSDFVRWASQPDVPDIDLSLHLARTPVTEVYDAQDAFIAHIRESTLSLHSIKSVGIHITGLRNEGIGILGFSSHYRPYPGCERNAARFVDKLMDRLSIPVWIENANYYSASSAEIFAAWKSIERLCDQTGARLIVDLSHLFIDARNNRLLPDVVLGAVPWHHAAEIHLSGVIEAHDGSLHDGHSRPVHAEVWRLLEHCLSSIVNTSCPPILTIEHTDPSWGKQAHLYEADFSALLSLVRATPTEVGSVTDRAYGYARNYLKKLVQQWIPKLANACEQRGVAFETIFDEWIEHVTKNEGRRIVLTREEVPPIEANQVRVAADSLLEFTKRQLKDVDRR